MLQQPMRLGGLALVYALATSALVLVTFLATNLVLSALGGIGVVGAVAADAGTRTKAPPAAVLLSSERETEGRCERPGRDRSNQRVRAAERCAEQRRNGGSDRP